EGHREDRPHVQGGVLVARREELRFEIAREHRVDVDVVPLDQVAGRTLQRVRHRAAQVTRGMWGAVGHGYFHMVMSEETCAEDRRCACESLPGWCSENLPDRRTTGVMRTFAIHSQRFYSCPRRLLRTPSQGERHA